MGPMFYSMELDANVNFWQFFPDLILLMVQKSGDHHLAYTKPCKSWESNYQPQLVSLPDFSYQQYYYHDVKHIPTHRIRVWYIYQLCICLIFMVNNDSLGWCHLTTCYTRKWLLRPKEVPFERIFVGGLLQYPYHPCMVYIYIHVPQKSTIHVGR